MILKLTNAPMQKCADFEIKNVNPRGRPKRSWQKVVEEIIKNLKIKRKTLWFAVNGKD